jgi:hypothetical protein
MSDVVRLELPLDLQALRSRVVRAMVEQAVQRLIDALDAADRAEEDREPDDEDEVMSEDDAVIVGWREVGRVV